MGQGLCGGLTGRTREPIDIVRDEKYVLIKVLVGAGLEPGTYDTDLYATL